jgi:glycosyltransferase involved in cell wall biosynthesis
MPDLSIIMPCHNRGHDLVYALQTYDRQVGAGKFELIAIDDASSDITYEVLTSFHPVNYTLRVERQEKNQGPAAARNKGIALAESPVLLFVGDDILPAENLVWGHVAAHKIYREKEIAILGRITWPVNLPINTLMAHIDGIGAQQFSYNFLQDGNEYDFRHFYTANISIKAEMLKPMREWFSTDFPFAAFEDAELAYRLSRRGLHIRYASALVGYHYHYHNIWTFAERQRKAGRMACLLISKHRLLLYKFRAQLIRVAGLLIQLESLMHPYSPRVLRELDETTCHMLSFYEWNPNHLLDWLYLRVLDYYYYDGVISGLFGETEMAQRLRSIHAERFLVPALFWYQNEATRNQIPTLDASRLQWLVSSRGR